LASSNLSTDTGKKTSGMIDLDDKWKIIGTIRTHFFLPRDAGTRERTEERGGYTILHDNKENWQIGINWYVSLTHSLSLFDHSLSLSLSIVFTLSKLFLHFLFYTLFSIVLQDAARLTGFHRFGEFKKAACLRRVTKFSFRVAKSPCLWLTQICISRYT
jgi:hypothetical protein